MPDFATSLAPDLLRLGVGNALAAAALAVLVAAITLPLRRRRPALVHALWLVVLLKLLTPPLWTLPVSWSAPQRTAEPAAPPAAEWTGELVLIEVEVVEEEVAAESPQPVEPAIGWRRAAAGAAGALWLAGSIACLALTVVRTLRFRRLLRHAEPVPPDVAKHVSRIAARLGVRRVPGALFVPGAVCPMLWAVGGGARLLLPRGLWERLDADQRNTLLAHELAHLLRRDHWVRLLELAATVLYWWHPALWWARRGLREAEEQCCDAWVVWSMPSAVRHYMSAILEAVDFVSVPQPPGAGRPARPAVPMLASGMGEFRRLERRLSMIRQNASPRRLSRNGLAAVLFAAAAALPLAPALAGDGAVTTADETPAQTTPTTAESAPRPLIVHPADGQVDQRTALVFDEVKYNPSTTAVSVDGGGLTAVDDRTPGSAMVSGGAGGGVGSYGELVVVKFDDSRLAAALAQARAEVAKIHAQLAAAQQRLKMLEAQLKEHPARAAKSIIPGKAEDRDRRIDQLEEKLDLLLTEMRELQKRRDLEERKETLQRR